jgi:hypothetical protein
MSSLPHTPATDLEKAVRHWIESEWRFRYGKDAYSNAATDAHCRSTWALRKALTGKEQLHEAGTALGTKEYTGPVAAADELTAEGNPIGPVRKRIVVNEEPPLVRRPIVTRRQVGGLFKE